MMPCVVGFSAVEIVDQTSRYHYDFYGSTDESNNVGMRELSGLHNWLYCKGMVGNGSNFEPKHDHTTNWLGML